MCHFYPRIQVEAFYAIIRVGELMFPETIKGITEASTTLTPSTPRSLNLLSTTALGSSAVPILQVPHGWKILVPISPAFLTRSLSVWY
jgi:hypothetical protein